MISRWQKYIRILSRQVCDFEKKRNDTVLRVAWNGALRLIHEGPNSASCRRWYFTLNGKECEQPMTIDTQISLAAKSINRHDPKYGKIHVCNIFVIQFIRFDCSLLNHGSNIWFILDIYMNSMHSLHSIRKLTFQIISRISHDIIYAFRRYHIVHTYEPKRNEQYSFNLLYLLILFLP